MITQITQIQGILHVYEGGGCRCEEYDGCDNSRYVVEIHLPSRSVNTVRIIADELLEFDGWTITLTPPEEK